MEGINEETYKKGGYADVGVKPESFRTIKSRTLGPDGKVYQGEVGKRLLKKRLEKQRFHERNK